MIERRGHARDKVIYGGVASVDEGRTTRECVVRNISAQGAQIEFDETAVAPKKAMALSIARKGRSFLARVIWWRDNFVGVAFSDETALRAPASDLEERLRISEKKKRQLQRRINELLGH
ncbi:MAG: PilZ domain-containing protein [Proteobacteria bacterium]|nr:PilZ domain-containing protein [Pseudomonadota bacterium]